MKPLTNEEIDYVDEAFARMIATRSSVVDVTTEIAARMGQMAHHLAVVAGPEVVADLLLGLDDTNDEYVDKYGAMHEAMRMKADIAKGVAKL